MKRSKRDHQSLGCFVVVLLCVVVLGCYSVPAFSEPLSLTISAAEGNSDYPSLLPVVLTIELKNEADTTQTILGAALGVVEFARSNGLERYRFEVRRPDLTSGIAHLCDWVNWTVDTPTNGEQRSLPPRRKQILDYCLGFGVGIRPSSWSGSSELRRQAGAVFGKAGEYQIRLVLPRLTVGPLVSNSVKVSVAEPKNPADARAYGIVSQSRWPEMFLSPLVLYSEPQGIPVFSGPPLQDGGTTVSPLVACSQVIGLCPDSSYAPYARLFLASALSGGWAERLSGQPARALDMDKRMEGIRLLHQAATDSSLPRRYREQALLNLATAAERLADYIRSEAQQKSPTLESVLGARVSIGDIPDDLVFQIARDIAKGKSPAPGYDELLRSKLTAAQYQALLKAALSDGSIAAAGSDDPLRKELQEHTDWARAELRKIPWRDPNTGQLNLAGVPLNVK